MKEIVLFGAGEIGQKAARYFMRHGNKVAYFIDNNCAKWGTTIVSIPVINLDEFEKKVNDYRLIISCNEENKREVIQQLYARGIVEYQDFWNCDEWKNRERIFSYASPNNREDIILYHVLHDISSIFYIDVGSADPVSSSVTKLLYDIKGAHGINVEPLKMYYNYTVRERSRDINLCIALSKEKEDKKKFYVQGGGSTLIAQNAKEMAYSVQVEVSTLTQVCQQYITKGQDIMFLKVDVEGAEQSVLEGADFQTYRPWIVVMESTLPFTKIPCYDLWEHILLDNNYHFVYSYGVNRYYVADEKGELDGRFISMADLTMDYNIVTVKYEPLIN